MMDYFTNFNFSLYAPHMVLVVILGVLLYNAHKNKDSSFSVFDYFTDHVTGKASISRTLQLIAGLTATWVIVQFTASGKLTYDIFGLYLIAVGASEAWTKYVAAKFGSDLKDVTSDSAKKIKDKIVT